eukprot:GHVU01142145.1.p1 GENE.GHVU01142145.1~~GHVU01142145.1.p1  ORF type:complete len:155 (+),score=7.83 GHVU01142145.1:326-790(+)
MIEEAVRVLLMNPLGLPSLVPWNEFMGEFRGPQRPKERILYNLTLYITNYIFLSFYVILVDAFRMLRPFFVIYLLQLAAVLYASQASKSYDFASTLLKCLVAANAAVCLAFGWTFLACSGYVHLLLATVVGLHVTFKTRRLVQIKVNKAVKQIF